MERVVVVGNPGSGKSTLARALGDRLDLPVTHLDRLYWRAGWQAGTRAEFRAALEPVAAGPRWVIEGNYASSYDVRLPRADLVVVLALPRRVTIPATVHRAVSQWGRDRPDMADGCPEKMDVEFLRYQWRYPVDGAPQIDVALREHAVPDDRVVRLGSRAAIRAWLSALP